MNLGESIYKYRTQKNMSQGDLADALDVSRQSVSKWENNSAVPELDKLIKMRELFEISLDELVSGKPPVPSAPGQTGISFPTMLSVICMVLAGISLIITILFGNQFAIHTDEGIMLSQLFALIGMIVRNPGNRSLFRICRRIYLPVLCFVVVFTFLPLLQERVLGYTIAYGIVLAVWWAYQRQKGVNSK